MIFASAIRRDLILAIGKRHCDCIKVLYKIDGVKPVGGEQGFVDERMNFYDRKRAAVYALKCGQIKKLKYSEDELYSEDIY